MCKLSLIAGLVLILSLLTTPFVQAQGEKPVVRGYLFYSRACPACHQTRQQVLPQLYKRFGRQLQIKAIDINADENDHQWLLACEKTYGLCKDEAAIPVLFIGDKYLIGTPDIASQLPSLIEGHLSSGGVDYPDVLRPGGALEPTVRFMFFYSPSCPHCEQVEEQVFPKIREEYRDRVQWDAYDTSEEAGYRALLILGDAFGLPPESRGAVPVVFIGDEFSRYSLLLGSGQIVAHLGSAVEWFMAVGGVGLPEWSVELSELAATPFPQPAPKATEKATPSPMSGTPSPGGPPIHVAYFGEVGCSESGRVSIALERLQERFPTLVVYEFDVIDDLSINICLCDALDVAKDQRHDAPAIFVGSDYLVGRDIQYERLIQIVSEYVDTGADPTWKACSEEVELPPPPPWWAVILPGLADGMNPCAFATIIFFVSYLSIIRRKGRDIIMVGISFALAVFLSYLAFGMLLREIFAGLVSLVGPILRPILNALTAILCLVLAVLSFADFRKARQGDVKDMALQLPHKLRMWINTAIRRGMRSQTLVIASFVSGVVVSFIELACTGQVYVPIIQGLSNPEHRAQSTLDLMVYCLAFVVPLIVVFVLSYAGTTSKQLTRFFNQCAAPVKLVMTVVFLAIGFWLVYDILRAWGVTASLMV